MRSRPRGIVVGAVTAATSLVLLATPASAQPFPFLEAPFTQQLVATTDDIFVGGIGFASDGDPVFTPCTSSGGDLLRADIQGTPVVIGGSSLAPVTSMPSDTGCGLTNHPNGSLYSNVSDGVSRLNRDTGAKIGSTFGPDGNVLGITVDPVTNNIVYSAQDGSIAFVDPEFTTSGTYAAGPFSDIDGLYFEPTGTYLFLAERSGDQIVIIKRDGTEQQRVAVNAPLDGIAFKAATPKFVITNNTDGTMSKIVFPNDDFTQVPTVTEFANGGFYGDLTQVGPDGCLYISQSTGTRFEDNTTTGDGSIVKICSGFAPPPGVGQEGTAFANCADGVDNDGDGLTDLADPDCPPPPTVPPTTNPTTPTTLRPPVVTPRFTG